MASSLRVERPTASNPTEQSNTQRKRARSASISPNTVVTDCAEAELSEYNELVDLVEESTYKFNEKRVLLVNFSDPATFFRQFSCSNAKDGKQMPPDTVFADEPKFELLGSRLSEWSRLGKKGQEEQWAQYRSLGADGRHALFKSKVRIIQTIRDTVRKLKSDDSNGAAALQKRSATAPRIRKKLLAKTAIIDEKGHGSDAGPDTVSGYVGMCHTEEARTAVVETIRNEVEKKKEAAKSKKAKNPANSKFLEKHKLANKHIANVMELGTKDSIDSSILGFHCNSIMLHYQSTDWNRARGGGSHLPTNGKLPDVGEDEVMAEKEFDGRLVILAPSQAFAESVINKAREIFSRKIKNHELVII